MDLTQAEMVITMQNIDIGISFGLQALRKRYDAGVSDRRLPGSLERKNASCRLYPVCPQECAFT